MRIQNRWTSLAVLGTAFTAWGCGGGDDMDEMNDVPETAMPTMERFTASLTGAAQRPQAVMTDATGSAEFTVADDGSITFRLAVANLSSTPTGAHIHGPATAGEAAPAIVRFALTDTVTTGQLSSGTITATAVPEISLDSLKVLMRAGAVYVNVHTANNGGGEILGVIMTGGS